VRFVALECLLIALGCSSQPAQEQPATCPNDLPASCPTPPPSYTNDVAKVLAARCVKCHGKGGVEETKPLDTYANVYSRRTTVLTQIYSCAMPPEGEDQLTAEERKTLLSWLVCKAPNN
jgi:uncharacterized membrane protein